MQNICNTLNEHEQFLRAKLDEYHITLELPDKTQHCENDENDPTRSQTAKPEQLPEQRELTT